MTTCSSKETHKSFCDCLEPHKSRFNNSDKILAKKIGEDYSKDFEKNMKSILKVTSLIQHKINNNYMNNKSGTAELSETLASAKSCRVDSLTTYLDKNCGEGTIYSVLKDSDSNYSLNSLIDGYKEEIKSRESNYMASDEKRCDDNYRCEFKSSCDLSDLNSEVISNDYKVGEIKLFLEELKLEMSQTNSFGDAMNLALKNRRTSKDVEGYRRIKDLYALYGNSLSFKSIFEQKPSALLKMINTKNGVSSFFESKEQILASIKTIEKKCEKTYESFKKFMCQSSKKNAYDFSDESIQTLTSKYNLPKSDYSGSYATCSVGNKVFKDDLREMNSHLTPAEVLIGNAEKLSIKNLKNNAHRVRTLLCENIPSKNKKLRRQIKEISKKIKSACTHGQQALLKYPNSTVKVEQERKESCVYLMSYKKMLEAKEQTKKFVEKNNSFKDYLKSHPSSPIKTEEEYIKKIGVPSVAKSLLLGGGESETDPIIEKTISKRAEEKVQEKTKDKNKSSITSQSTNSAKNAFTFKRAPASVDQTQSPSSISSSISAPAGLTFKYKEPSASEISKDIEKLREKVANEKRRQEEILKNYNSSTLEEQRRIESEFDIIDSSFSPSPNALSSDEVDRFIENERLIDSGLRSADKVRSIANANLSNFINPSSDPFRETINNDILTKDRIDLVDQNIASSEKISAFNIELGPNGYEIQKLIVSGSIEKDLSLVYDRDPNKSIVDKISRSSASQSEQVQKYKKLLQSKKDFLISKNSELDIEVIVRYNFNLQKHEVSPFVGNLNDEFYLKNKVEYSQLKDQVQKSIDEGDFRALSQI